MAETGSESMMQQAQHMWAMLDDMSSNDPAAYRKFISKQLKEGKEAMKPPEPHMCVATILLPSGRNIYMNICEWNRIPAPKTDQDPIPVMGGNMYELKGKTGPYKCITLAFHPTVLKDFGIETSLMEEQQLLINLACDFLEHQHKVKVSRQYALQPISVRFKGDLKLLQSSIQCKVSKSEEQFQKDMQEIQKTFAPPDLSQEPLISQLGNITLDGGNNSISNSSVNPKEPEISILSGDKPVKRGLIEEVSSKVSVVKEPEYTLTNLEGSPRHLIAKIKLPGVATVADCSLDITEDDLTLEVEGQYHLSVKLPDLIIEDQASAKFSKRSQILTVRLPVAR